MILQFLIVQFVVVVDVLMLSLVQCDVVISCEFVVMSWEMVVNLSMVVMVFVGLVLEGWIIQMLMIGKSVVFEIWVVGDCMVNYMGSNVIVQLMMGNGN